MQVGHLRSQLGSKMSLRYIPELIFVLDDSMEYGAHIQDILKEVMKDVKQENNDSEG